MTYIANITAASSSGAWTTINTNDSAGVIRSILFNNPTTNSVVMRRKSNTNISVSIGNCAFNLPRMNTGDLEVQSATTNAIALIVCCGCPENPA